MNFDALQDGLVITLNIASMLAMGLSLTVSQLGGAVRRVGPLALGLGLNLVLAPLLAWGLAGLLAMPAAFGLGLLICGAAAGGNMGPLFTANARGDIAYSVALVVILSFVSVASVPFVLGLLADPWTADIRGQAPRMMAIIVQFQIAPLVAGMIGHAISPRLALRAAPVARVIANASLVALTVGLLVTKGGLILGAGVLPLLAVEGFVLVLLASGMLLGMPRDPTGRALGLSTCTRNLVLSMLMASQLFRAEPLVMMGVLTYGLLWILTAMPMSFLLRRFAR
jgi:bile acid:Na+ symporter, BASS family